MVEGNKYSIIFYSIVCPGSVRDL